MKRPHGPCYGCEDRTAEDPETRQRDCHRFCEKYAAFKEEMARYKQELRDTVRFDYAAKYRPWRHKGRKDVDEKRIDGAAIKSTRH